MTTPTPPPTPAADDGYPDDYAAFNAPAIEAERRVLDARPEQPAVDVINAMTVDAAAFGTIPGATAAAGRVTAWADRSRAEMGRVVAEVSDLTTCAGTMRDMCIQADADTRAVARSATPR